MRRVHTPSVAVRFISGMLLAPLAACCPYAFYELIAADPAVRLPLDEAPHCHAGGEWWYYTGRLSTDAGRVYGIEAVIFHGDLLGTSVTLAVAWVAHFSVLDEAEGIFVYDQTLEPGPSPNDASPGDGFDLDTPLVQMTGYEGRDHVRAAMPDGSYELDLVLDDQREVVLHGGDGYVPYGPYGHAFYYSRPIMAASGTLHVDGEPHAVTGSVWFDRQWGMDLRNPHLTWDWFSLRFDDGTAVMLFDFRGDETPPVSLGTFMPAVGEPVPLESDQFTITPTAWWSSPHTGRTYPVAWDIDIEPHALRLTVTAAADDQEFDARSSTFNVYWEGLCNVTGTRADQPVTGHAYVELTNYPS